MNYPEPPSRVVDFRLRGIGSDGVTLWQLRGLEFKGFGVEGEEA